MKNLKLLVLGVITSAVLLSGAHAQGLLGERYVEFYGAFARLDLPGLDDINGGGGGILLNAPIEGSYVGQIGVDAAFEAGYIRFSGQGVTMSTFGLEALVRGYAPVGFGLKPYIGSGLSWAWTSISAPGTRGRDDGFGLPLEIGVEFAHRALSATPYFRYIWALQSNQSDVWQVGAKGAYWFDRGFGLTLDVSHTDMGRDREILGVTAGIVLLY
jgi:hypothetical protein